MSSFSLTCLEAVVEARIGRRVVGPHHAGAFPRAERHPDEIAGRKRELQRRPVRIGTIERDRNEHIDDAHWAMAGRFGGLTKPDRKGCDNAQEVNTGALIGAGPIRE